MLNRRPRRSMSQMKVVPYIDVMLVLLVIFMVTTPMFSPGVVNLPSVGAVGQLLCSFHKRHSHVLRASGPTIQCRRTRFAGRLISGVRPQRPKHLRSSR